MQIEHLLSWTNFYGSNGVFFKPSNTLLIYVPSNSPLWPYALSIKGLSQQKYTQGSTHHKNTASNTASNPKNKKIIINTRATDVS